MKKTEQSLKKLEKTLERYQKNKTLVSPEDLKGTVPCTVSEIARAISIRADRICDQLLLWRVESVSVGKPGIEAAISG